MAYHKVSDTEYMEWYRIQYLWPDIKYKIHDMIFNTRYKKWFSYKIYSVSNTRYMKRFLIHIVWLNIQYEIYATVSFTRHVKLGLFVNYVCSLIFGIVLSTDLFLSIFQKYPEKYIFDGMQDLSQQHQYLPVYFGNVCLRFIPVSTHSNHICNIYIEILEN